jgi:hypothetical protein
MQWYYNNAATQIDINKLLSTQDRLSALSYNIAVVAGELKDDYNRSYYIRKVHQSRQKQAFIEAGDKISEAVIKAEGATAEEIKNETEAEAASYKIDLMLRQVNRVLQAMQQRISHLKKEWEYSKHITQEQ